jgi:hypothetical protein
MERNNTFTNLEGELRKLRSKVVRSDKTKDQASPKSETRKAQPKSATKSVPKLEQWIEVTVENGITVTRLFPPNDVLQKEATAASQTPLFVNRRFFFPGGVPEEYFWAVQDEEKRQSGGAGVQRMYYETWLRAAAEEKRSGAKHVGPVDTLPRLTAEGECDCAACLVARQNYR